jgi:hypothetical protein
MLYFSVPTHLILYKLITLTVFIPEYKLKKWLLEDTVKINTVTHFTSVRGEFQGGSLVKDQCL